MSDHSEKVTRASKMREI